MTEVVVVIPARFGSTRFPGKPLAPIDGVPMILRVVRQVQKCKKVQRIIVATDDPRIEEVVKPEAEVCMTGEHANGTLRILEVVDRKQLSENQIIINVQGDEPLIRPEDIDLLAELTRKAPGKLATLCSALEEQEAENENAVKVVKSLGGKALYFSRSKIPFPRESGGKWWKHIGLYGYGVEVLRSIAQLPVSQLSITESLEQLAWLENDLVIQIEVVDECHPSVDVPADIHLVENLLKTSSDGLQANN